MATRIALVGDFSAEVVAHRAIPLALELAQEALGVELIGDWVRTRDLRDAARDLAGWDAVWLVPGSPYENPAGALDAVRFARESHRPFLGTCGGFQHALIEFARNVAGLAGADHAETAPDASAPIIAPLACSLVEQDGVVRFAPDSLVRSAFGCDNAPVRYHCRFGFNAAYRDRLESAGLRFTAFDEHGEIRAAELSPARHPFFVGTLFQPERSALRGELPPLARAFAAAAILSSAHRG